MVTIRSSKINERQLVKRYLFVLFFINCFCISSLAAEISVGAWKKIPIFKFLANNLDLSTKELYRTFNMGIGLALVVEESKKSTMMRALENEGCVEIGKIITGPSKEVHLNEQ